MTGTFARAARLAGKVAAAGILAFLGIEAGLRLLAPRLDGLRASLVLQGEEQRYDDVDTLEGLLERSILGYQPYGDFCGFVLNAKGLHAHDYADRKAAGTYRVVALGDSFTFAAGCVPQAEHWLTRLGASLEAGLGRPVEVLNLGVPGVGPRFERRMFQIEGSRLDADLVLQAVFAGNDFIDEKGAEALGEAPPWIVRASWFARALRNLKRRAGALEEDAPRLSLERHPERAGTELPGYAEARTFERPSFSEEAYAELEGWLLRIHRLDRRDVLLRVIGDTVETIARLRDDVRATGAEFLVVVIPDEFQVDPAVRAAALESAGLTEADVDVWFAQRHLGALLRERGVDVVDLLPAFRAGARERPLYRPRDTHWNAAGCAFAADRIAAHRLSRD